MSLVPLTSASTSPILSHARQLPFHLRPSAQYLGLTHSSGSEQRRTRISRDQREETEHKGED